MVGAAGAGEEALGLVAGEAEALGLAGEADALGFALVGLLSILGLASSLRVMTSPGFTPDGRLKRTVSGAAALMVTLPELELAVEMTESRKDALTEKRELKVSGKDED